MATIWVIVGVVVGLAAFIWFLSLLANGVVQFLVILLLLGFLCWLLTPAVQSAREAAYRYTAAGNLKQIGSALENREDSMPDSSGGSESVAAPIAHVREWFPETLLWRPEVVTDDNGRATLDIDLADSITDWRAVGQRCFGGREAGRAESLIRVFQPFFVDVNLPLALVRATRWPCWSSFTTISTSRSRSNCNLPMPRGSNG